MTSGIMSDVVLQKILAKRAEVSRREATRLIEQGRVKVNGRPAELGMRVTSRDRVALDGNELTEPYTVTVAYYKPRGVTSTLHDPHARVTLSDVLPSSGPRLAPAGRLDLDSEGLMILSNDGDLINRLTHPSFEHEKEYEIVVRGKLNANACAILEKGIALSEGLARADRCEIVNPKTLHVVLHQGWRRQLRRMLEKLNYEILSLKRIRVGKLYLGKLKPGEMKEVRQSDIL